MQLSLMKASCTLVQFLIRIVQQSGLLNHFVPGDMIMADRGFLIHDILPNGVSLNIPPFLNNVYLQKVRQKPQNRLPEQGSM